MLRNGWFGRVNAAHETIAARFGGPKHEGGSGAAELRRRLRGRGKGADDKIGDPSRWLDAAPREPVPLRHQKRQAALALSPREYSCLRAVTAEDSQPFCDRAASQAAARGLTETNLARLLTDKALKARRRP